jgi:D-inositol-3-phosphate glycosyltransferase
VPRARLLAVGQGLIPTGYARVAESVLARIGHAFEATLFAINHYGPDANGSFDLRGNRLLGDPYGREQLPGLLRELKPDVVLVHHDASLYPVHAAALDAYRAARPDARVVVYCPTDWPNLPAPIPRALVGVGVDELVLYTHWGRRAMSRAFRDLGLAVRGMSVIPHGVDRERFAPLVPGDLAASRALARRKLFGARAGLEDAFVVLNANRNTRRKRIDLSLRGFALFARERPGARLYLHMGMVDQGCDVRALAEKLGIADKLLTTLHGGRRPSVPDEHLNLVYNACDVGLSTSAAEGFGLVALEHAAAGAAQVMPDHTAFRELWRDRALLVRARPSGSAGWVVSAEGVASALARMHDEPALRASLAARAHALATSPELGWPAIAQRWERLLAAQLSGSRR